MILYNYNKIWVGNASNPNTIQGNNTTYAIIKGNNTVQQTDINWSKRILGKEALTQIKTKINKPVFNAKFKGEEETFENNSSKIAWSILNTVFNILIKKSTGIMHK